MMPSERFSTLRTRGPGTVTSRFLREMARSVCGRDFDADRDLLHIPSRSASGDADPIELVSVDGPFDAFEARGVNDRIVSARERRHGGKSRGFERGGLRATRVLAQG